MKRAVLALTILTLFITGVFVEEDLRAQPVSPEVHPDGRVTFRLKAPDADTVLVEGLGDLDPQPMRLGADGLWEATVGPLAPELYSYVFVVDGANVADPRNRQVKKWLDMASLVEVPGGSPLLHEQQAVPHGIVHQHVYASSTTGGERGVYVYTPPAYRQQPDRKYPLLLLLHGYGDDESAWLEVGRVHRIADNLLAGEKIQPMVIAMPYGHPLPIDDRLTFDNYSERNIQLMEQDLFQDLLPHLNREYRLREGREHRAIVGLSMGGGQSLTIGFNRLEEIAWIGGFSSACPRGNVSRQFAPLLEDVERTNRQLRLLWIGCGRDDFLAERNQTFVEWLESSGLRHTYRLTDGGHNWMVWRKYLAELLPLLFR